MEIEKEMNNKKSLGGSYNNIGSIYSKQGNYTEALKYLFKSLEIAKEINNKSLMSEVYNNLGLLFSSISEKNDSLRKKVLEWMKDREDLFNKEAITEDIKEKMLSLAEHHQIQAFEITKQLSDDEGMTSSLVGLGDIAV